ncbi:MAG: ribose 5-phosphate isomerase B [Desulfobacterales bacterium]|nr:ribose 5-phosphate isomerase B [Desulfobacterales bacterium]
MFENKSPIIIGSDHAGYILKEKVKTFLKNHNIEFEDIGTDSEEKVDYSDFGIKVANAVSKGKFERGILICGTGLGMSMVANRFPHVKAALCNHIYSSIMSRRHNNSNILIMGGRIISDSLAIEILKAWLDTQFEGGRHQVRLDKFDKIDFESLKK